MKTYTLKKAKSLFKTLYKLYLRKKSMLSLEVAEKIRITLLELQEAILNRDREKANFFARELEGLSKKNIIYHPWEKWLHTAGSLLVALLIAILIRQTAFELFEIPSGSMRPTFKEQDRLVVSKSQFALNLPLTTSHLFFKPEEVKRMGVVIFTGQGMDIPNVKTLYFYLFPGYKQYIKRMIGLPGDTLYFYGGKIYGIDKQGNDITPQLQLESLSYLEHIPYIHIEGKVLSTKGSPERHIDDLYPQVVLKQMNLPIAKLSLSASKEVHKTFLSKPNPQSSSNQPLDFYNYWGIENFATARILPKAVVATKKNLPYSLQEADFYLELSHHPSAIKAALGRDHYFRQRPELHIEKSYIALSHDQMKKIWENMVTGRFSIEEDYLRRYGVSLNDAKRSTVAPQIKEAVPKGTYEFTAGKLFAVKAQGVLAAVPEEHPLALFDPWKCFLFFNTGIECDTRFLPQPQNDRGILPARYAYFRDGDLYIMGAPILSKDDPTLITFLENESSRKSSQYTPFLDLGAPLKADGSLDIEKIKQYGIQVPERSYLVLGDNHAMSADSRDFGFVPEGNLRGTPSFMFWAPNDRFGFPNNGLYPFFTLPRLVIYLILLTSFLIWRRHEGKHKQLLTKVSLG